MRVEISSWAAIIGSTLGYGFCRGDVQRPCSRICAWCWRRYTRYRCQVRNQGFALWTYGAEIYEPSSRSQYCKLIKGFKDFQARLVDGSEYSSAAFSNVFQTGYYDTGSAAIKSCIVVLIEYSTRFQIIYNIDKKYNIIINITTYYNYAVPVVGSSKSKTDGLATNSTAIVNLFLCSPVSPSMPGIPTKAPCSRLSCISSNASSTVWSTWA